MGPNGIFENDLYKNSGKVCPYPDCLDGGEV